MDSMNKVLQGGGITGFVELLSSTRALRRPQESNDQPRLHLLFSHLEFISYSVLVSNPQGKEGPERERV